ncbi:MAG: glycoside hydrolase family 10 protein [Anaerolineae bacterium]
MRKALLCALLALAALVALVLAAPPPRLEAAEPTPPAEISGMDDIYIDNGWTDAYPSKAVAPALGTAASKDVLPNRLFLPLVANSEPMRETRAVWVTRWDFSTKANIQAIVDNAAYANLNVILFQVRGQADALYTPGLEPWSAVLGALGQDPGWDPLAEMVTRAHAKGIEVHAWINTYPVWLDAVDPVEAPPSGTTPEHMYHTFYRSGNEWLQWTKIPRMPMPLKRNEYLCANPAHPAVQDRVVNVCRDIVTRYAVDGIHLDYVRYADNGEYSYDPITDAAVQGGISRPDYQRAQVTGLVQRLSIELHAIRPGVRLTAAVWPVYVDKWGWVSGNDGYNAKFQDSHGWAKNALADAILPMLYTNVVNYPNQEPCTDCRPHFEALAADHVQGARPGAVFIGLSPYRGKNSAGQELYWPADEVMWRIEEARRAGAHGQALFSYRVVNQQGLWQALRDGPYRSPALPNWP